MRERLVPTILLFLLAAAAPDGAGKPPADPDLLRMDAQQQQTVGLRTEPVISRPIVATLHLPGTIALDPALTARLRPIGDARVIRLLVQQGDTVKAGDGLADLFSGQIAAAQDSVASVRAQVREAADAVAVARDALRRAQLLARDGSLAWAEVGRRRLLVEQAQAQAATVQARQSSLTAELSGLGAAPPGAPGTKPGAAIARGIAHLTTPIGGVVAEVNVTTGALTGPSAGADAFVVADLSDVIALAQVAETDAVRVQPGQRATVALGAGSAPSAQAWTGTVFATGAIIDPHARTLPVRIRVANPDGRLRAGMAVAVTLFAPTGGDGLVVPPSAVQLVGSDHVAFTDEGGGSFRRHTLDLGVERADWIEVRRGLSVGQRVVTDGSFALKTVLQKSMLGGG